MTGGKAHHSTISDPGWEAAVPDIERWVEIRSMLLGGEASTLGTPDGGLVIDSSLYIAGVVGWPDDQVIAAAVEILMPDAEILVPPEAVDHVVAALGVVTRERAVLHRLRSALPPSDHIGVGVTPVDSQLLGSLPPQLASEAEGAAWAAVRRVDGQAVSLCTAWWLTETLWDVGVDTLEDHRRQGHARACFLALEQRLRSRSLQPVWGALEENAASLAMAASLGFEPVDELWVVRLTDADGAV
jgi:GNAT superfamily N-acetyltransferase